MLRSVVFISMGHERLYIIITHQLLKQFILDFCGPRRFSVELFVSVKYDGE